LTVKINALKLVREVVRTKIETLLQAPITLDVQELQDKLDQIDQKIESKENSYATPTDILLHNR